MKCLLLDRPGHLALEEVASPGYERECRIRVRMAGICGTDLQMLDGYAGFRGVPGHEFVGVVEDVSSSDDTLWLGRRVAGEINIGCGRCDACASGVKEHCVNRTVLGIRGRNGAFAEYVSLPSRNLHVIPDHLADEAAVFVEPVAAACRILEQIRIDEDARIAVVGDGRMGLLVSQVLRTVAPQVTLFGRHDHKLEVARTLGIQARRSGDRDSATERFDIVVDVTGRPEGFRQALDMVRPRGTVVLKSTFHGEAPIASWPIVVDEVTIVGSRCGPFDRGIAMLASGAIRVEPLIARVLPLEDHAIAFAEARRNLKVLFAIGK